MASDADFFEMLLEGQHTDDPVVAIRSNGPREWHDRSPEGQLAVDIADIGDMLAIIAPIAGGDVDSLEIYIQDDLLTIRGTRKSPLDMYTSVVYHHQESFWGPFSRTIVLPVLVEGYRAQASYKKGVLCIEVPKKSQTPFVPITIIEE